jgi:DNA-binding transcriptional LysR family regulator
MDAGHFLDGLLRQLVERYPDVEIEVKPALEVEALARRP